MIKVFENLRKKRLQKKLKNTEYTNTHELVYMNNMIDIVHDAAITCYNTKPKNGYNEEAEFISKLIKSGHESVLEHSNLVYLEVTDNKDAVLSLMNECHYLNTKISFLNENQVCLVLGGSIRAYKHLFRNTKDLNNPVLQNIQDILLRYTDDRLYIDLINDDIFKATELNTIEINNNFSAYETSTDTDDVIFRNIDNTEGVYHTISKYGFSYRDVMDLCTVTIRFDHMSRIITQQLTRHRNGITQMSQRYCDFSGKSFNSPELFKPEYDSDQKYNIKFGDVALSGTMTDIGNDIADIYSQMVEQGVKKEDARAFLPQNIDSGILYMTFTYSHLLSFLKLRTDNHAQAEIRDYAIVIEESFLPLLYNSMSNCGIVGNHEYTELIDPVYKDFSGELNISKNVINLSEEILDEDTSIFIPDDEGKEIEDVYETDKSYDDNENFI